MSLSELIDGNRQLMNDRRKIDYEISKPTFFTVYLAASEQSLMSLRAILKNGHYNSFEQWLNNERMRDIGSLTYRELRRMATHLGLDLPRSVTKEELIKEIRKYNAGKNSSTAQGNA